MCVCACMFACAFGHGRKDPLSQLLRESKECVPAKKKKKLIKINIKIVGANKIKIQAVSEG